MLKALTKDFSDMAGEITEGSVCGAMGAGAGAVSGIALTAAGVGFSTPVAIGSGITIGIAVFKGCKGFGLDDEIKQLLNK